MILLNSVLFFLIGLILLVWGSSLFVDSAVGIAKHFNIPEVIIGATVLSFGTTLPEVLYSVTASFQGFSDMALGNALGSVICNTGFIAAISLIISPVILNKKENTSILNGLLWIASAIILYICCSIFEHRLSRAAGVLLIFLCVLNIKFSLKGEHHDSQESVQTSPEKYTFLKLLPEVVMLYIGALLLVNHGPVLARAIGVPEVVISLTFVALGTSLPELMTSLTAIRKKHTTLSLGNIIGANTLNLLLVGGLSSVVHPISLTKSTMFLEIPVIIFMTLVLCLPTVICQRSYRSQGILLLFTYAMYILFLFG